MLKEVMYYVEGSCINCGRDRVEAYTNGDLICEKCSFNQLTEQFEDLDELALLQLEENYRRNDPWK